LVMQFLNILQRTIEPLPIRGKVRLAEAILRHVRCKEVECHPLPGITVFLRTNQRIERWMWAGAYERELVQLMKRTIKAGMTVLDVGANVGYFSTLASGLVGNTGQVHAFEPMPQNLSRLRQNLGVFRWAHSYPYAVGDATGTAVICFNESEAGWASLLTSNDLERRADINIIRLDDWVRDHAVNRIDFMKMDIEGGEFQALLGAQELLSRFRPVIVAELNAVCLARSNRKPEDVLALLRGLGYDCSPFKDGVLAIPQIPPVPNPDSR
jgi:FkbM family methyltransferase